MGDKVNTLAIVPCKFEASRPCVIDCVTRLREHHPEVDVMVVDSDSEDRSYFAEVEKLGAQVLDAHNRNYGVGGFRRGVDVADDYDRYWFLFDSLLVNRPLELNDQPLTTVRYFEHPPTPWGADRMGADLYLWGAAALSRIGINCPAVYAGVFGPMWFCDAQVVDDLRRAGFWSLLPDDKWQACAMERVAGIVLERLGYDVRNSLQGRHVGHYDPYDETFVTKLDMARA